MRAYERRGARPGRTIARRPEHRGAEGGFTLIEMMISITIMVIIVAGVLLSFLGQRSTNLNQENVAEVQGNLRAGMALMKRDVRNAGFLTPDVNSITAGNNNGLNATDQITVSSTGLGEDWIYYGIMAVGGVPTLIRSTDQARNAPNDIEVIPNVEDMQLAYAWDANGNNQIDAAEWVNDPTGNVQNVEVVRMSLIVRSLKPDPARQNYRRPALEDRAAGVATDAFPRRLLTTIVKIRNKGL